MHHTPVSKSALVSTEAQLARPVDIPNWPAEPKLDKAKVGPRGRVCTCNLSVLSGGGRVLTPSALGYKRVFTDGHQCSRSELH